MSVIDDTLEVDYVAIATFGKQHSNDPGMDDFEGGWEEFTLGTRVEVRDKDGTWRKGTVMETYKHTERGIHVKCDEKWHDGTFYDGHGCGVMVYMQRRRNIVSVIRKIDEPPVEVIIPRKEPRTLEGNEAELLKITETAVQHSGGSLRLAYNEEDETEMFDPGAQRFLKYDGKRVARDIETYCFMATVAGWEQALISFLYEILLPMKANLPESYSKTSEILCKLGESVYPEDMLDEWRKLF